MSPEISCWKCGAPLEGLIMPLSRREECKNCGADQHACKLCKEYNPTISRSCEEDRAEDVSDKESANFCDYFSPTPQAYQSKGTNKRTQAKAELAKLFGDNLDKQNNDNIGDIQSQTQAEKALSDLEDLFRQDK
ncbi:hypothetical protein [Alkalimarinus sediminis]|uniref:Uncharacterized protein n=1 Tax=Alkalimarinus sediminis TaxID=1632866 RepID=A0A9E8HN74_9ALTE|nr:hypothetical protein [Alkalimarinus sediminis]UZW76377.1 hypothetical protein NNL22_07260 [Alkalimarinus sediminis]